MTADNPWLITPPMNVLWSPDEMEQISRAIQAFQDALPGKYIFVELNGMTIRPTKTRLAALTSCPEI